MKKKYNFSCEYRQKHPESESTKLFAQFILKLIVQTNMVEALFAQSPSESVTNLCRCRENHVDCTSNPHREWPEIHEWYFFNASDEEISRLYDAGIVYLNNMYGTWIGFTSNDGACNEFIEKLADVLYN